MSSLRQNKVFIGWVEAFAAILIFLGVNQVFGRYSAVVLEVSPILYSCAAFCSCALVLLLIGGRGPLARETMRSMDTWVYGTILMMSYIVGLLLFTYVTSTEGTILQKISVLLSLLCSWFFIGRKPDKYQLLGTAIVTIGVVLVCRELSGPNVGRVYLLAFCYGALQVARIFTAEFHRPYVQATTQAKDPRAKARVVGFVMFVISVIFMSGSLLVAVAQHAQDGDVISGLPVLADFMHPPTILAGMLCGVIIVAPSRLLEFSSTSIIKTENFTAVTTLSFLSTLFWEWSTAPLTGLSIKAISGIVILAGGFITFGGLLIALTRRKAKAQKKHLDDYIVYAPQNLELIDDSREVVAGTLEHFDMDIRKSADALGVPKWVIELVLADDDKVIAFKNFNEVSRRFRTHVSNRDGLTGLLNRSGFMVAFKKALSAYKSGAVFYVDLDKFKPINDTYGHDAGDAVLNLVARRLEKHLFAAALITRMGGDEYCVFAPNVKQPEMQKIKTMLERELAQPYTLDDNLIVEISASIGTAHYPEEGTTPAELISSADKGMYGVKHAVLDV